MKGLIYWLQRHFSQIYKALLLLGSILLIVQVFPRQTGFEYEYQEARPWLHEDLIAPFDFAILKTAEELAQDREYIEQQFRPFFEKDLLVAPEQKQSFETALRLAWAEREAEFPAGMSLQDHLQAGQDILDSLFDRGVIFLEDHMLDTPGEEEIRLLNGRVAELHRADDFFSLPGAQDFIARQLRANEKLDTLFLRPLIEQNLVHNVRYHAALSEQALADQLDNIPLSRGMVQQGEKIISQGELVSAGRYQVLESFRAEFERQSGQLADRYLLYLGQFLLVSISMVVLLLFLWVFRKDTLADNRRVLLILLTMILMVLITGQVVRLNLNLLYLIPVCIVPVVIRAFFDNRLALYVHINTIILIGFLIPRSFEFVFLQFIAGIIAILSVVSLRRRSQLFLTATLVFLTYSAVYTGLSLAHTGTLASLNWLHYLYFFGAALLTLFAYPLIFLFERLFALPTDFSLLELADTNNKLLRQLGMSAPGTLQHSLQVANLAEEAVFAIGGNTLLTRTGALYHDIGKMEDARYFVENQSAGYNPHDEITYEESARIIIRHVIKGIELARKHHLPEYIIDFIRTHHGTTTARYFYTMHVNENPEKEADRDLFTYPGPRPFSKETAVVMMADAVEAASRSLEKPAEDTISLLVDQLIDAQIAEQQFENASITFKDITTVKKIFKQRLMNIYHVRIAYPAFT